VKCGECKEKKKGHELTLEWVVHLLKTTDFEKNAPHLGLEQVRPGAVLIPFLGRTYQVSKDGIELVRDKFKWSVVSESFDYDLKSVLGYYVLSEGKSGPLFDFCALTNFSHGIFRDDSSALRQDPVAEAYKGDYGRLAAHLEKLGFVFEGEKAGGQYVWCYTLFPKLPVKIIWYEGDDEYPSKVQMLFDRTAIEYLRFEPLAALNMSFIRALASTAACNF